MKDETRRIIAELIAEDACRLLTQEEAERIAAAVERAPRKRARGEKAMRAEIERAFAWARQVRLDAGLLENVLKGGVYVQFRGGRREPEFSLSAEGRAEAERLVDEARGAGSRAR